MTGRWVAPLLVGLLALPTALHVAGNDAAATSTGQWPSGEVARDYIESYVMTHPFRAPLYPPFREAAQQDLAALLDDMGLDVEVDNFGRGVNIIASQPGTTNPEQWVVLSAHYDTLDVGFGATVFGAWDNGAGVSALLALAEAFRSWEFPFTIVYAFFDMEEISMGGSNRFVERVQDDPSIDLVANINTDPPGLNWPCGDPNQPFHVKVIHYAQLVDSGDPRSLWLRDAIEGGILAAGVPSQYVDRTETIHLLTVGGLGPIGTSDQVQFGRRGVANVYLGGTPTYHVAGEPGHQAASAIAYPIHTPLDTLEVLEARCLEGSLIGGLQTILDIITHALTTMAGTAIPPAPGAVPDVPSQECITWTYPATGPMLPAMQINMGQVGYLAQQVGQLGRDVTCDLVALPAARDAADRILYGSVRTFATMPE